MNIVQKSYFKNPCSLVILAILQIAQLSTFDFMTQVKQANGYDRSDQPRYPQPKSAEPQRQEQRRIFDNRMIDAYG